MILQRFDIIKLKYHRVCLGTQPLISTTKGWLICRCVCVFVPTMQYMVSCSLLFAFTIAFPLLSVEPYGWKAIRRLAVGVGRDVHSYIEVKILDVLTMFI